MGEKKKALTVECQLTNVEKNNGKRETPLGNHQSGGR